MTMQFTPKTERELREAMLVPAADYDFEVLEATDETSKKGNPMIKLKIGLYVGDRIKNHVTDYILSAMEAKLRHFCDTVGLLSEYESGSLSADMCKGRSGKVRIIVEDKDPAYPPKNAVKDYVVRPAKPLGANDAPPQAEKDDLPF